MKMHCVRRVLALSVLGLAAGCGSTGTNGNGHGGEGSVGTPDHAYVPPVEEAAWNEGVSRAGMFRIQWRTRPEPVPSNEHFELDVRLFRGAEGNEPLSGARVLVSAWMPDHKHGMLVQPRAEEVAPGEYVVRGMLFHMGGFWQLFFDVIENDVSERADFEVRL